jgi:DNA repair protein RecO (recombination protein O)
MTQQQYTTEALILSVRDMGEADRLVVLFSREFGKISAGAYGARRTRSRLAGPVQAFSLVEVSLLPGRTLDSIGQCEVKRSFSELREDMMQMTYASFLTELVSELWPDRSPEPSAFDVLKGALALLSQRNPRLVSLAGAWQLLALAGFHPEYERCVTCGQVLSLPAYFDACAGGGVCPTCNHDGLLVLDDIVCGFVDKLLNVNWNNPQAFKVTGASLLQAEKMLIEFIAHRIERPLKSVRFLHMMKGTERLEES